MKNLEEQVARHYTRGDLETALIAGLKAIGRDGEAPLAPQDLNGLDEFHIGGHEATSGLVARLGLAPGMAVLDIGSGTGGPARHMARAHGVRVSGIDLTPEYVAVAQLLTRRAGLEGSVDFKVGSAEALPYADASFDAATLMHVGMNLPDKAAVFAEVARVLRPGGVFAIYDVMRVGEGELRFPLPWASGPETSFVRQPEEYREALGAAGFAIAEERDRRDFALDVFRRLRARQSQASGPPALGLHLALGAEAPAKTGNMVANIERGVIAPVEMICRRT